jgi:hypothetical protein
VERKKQEECFIPNEEAKASKLPPFSAFFFSLWFFFLCVFFFFLLLEKKKMPRRKSLKEMGKNRRQKVGAKSENA